MFDALADGNALTLPFILDGSGLRGWLCACLKMLGINVNGPTAVWEADYRWKDQSWVMAITQNESTGKFFAFYWRTDHIKSTEITG